MNEQNAAGPDPRGKNRLVGLGLAAVVVLLFLVTLVRLKGGV